MPTYYGLRIKLHPQVYEPAEDTFLLAENLKIREGDIALDMGTGTGIIALLMAKKAKFVLGVDINPIAVELAKENARINEIKNVEFRVSDLFENVEGKFDIITFNSPYLPGEAGELKEPIDLALIGGKRGREVLDRFISQVKDYLKPNGIVQVVQSSITGVEDTIEKFTKLGFSVEITAKKRYFFEEILVITAKLNESS
ncbi:HemK2/MTQ2 family protein methyltransferase [Thermococcus barophilus]|uniref:Methyltransferase small domain-containing protein n=1 Tax=Thermococcus barophilus TaxID=55802 RepID=A0A0S1XF20_THEBA|nr:HemK2/MTQ2 family protein methyltransferase [Thermococcus barophilus]ALM76302.1 hypothetical protein TBCH5v1_2411 [Thermococcus barophilus]